MKKRILFILIVGLIVSILLGILGGFIYHNIEQARECERRKQRNIDEARSHVMEMAQIFNSSFISNIGDSIKSQQVKSLILSVISSNFKENERQITITYNEYGYGPNTKNDLNVGKINSSKKYNAKVAKYDDDGYICEIEIFDI